MGVCTRCGRSSALDQRLARKNERQIVYDQVLRRGMDVAEASAQRARSADGVGARKRVCESGDVDGYVGRIRSRLTETEESCRSEIIAAIELGLRLPERLVDE